MRINCDLPKKSLTPANDAQKRKKGIAKRYLFVASPFSLDVGIEFFRVRLVFPLVPQADGRHINGKFLLPVHLE